MLHQSPLDGEVSNLSFEGLCDARLQASQLNSVESPSKKDWWRREKESKYTNRKSDNITAILEGKG
jgi:hypothetical protein